MRQVPMRVTMFGRKQLMGFTDSKETQKSRIQDDNISCIVIETIKGNKYEIRAGKDTINIRNI